MEKEPRKSVNFDENAEVTEYEDDFDDEFDEDSEEEINSQTLKEETPDNKNVEQIELKVKPQSYQIPISDNRSSVTRRNSMLACGANRRGTVYEPKPDDFSYDPTLEGPIDARVITDICCFMMFFVFLAIWAFSTCLVFNMGNLERFAVPKSIGKSSKYQLCGINENKNYNYELNFNFFQCIDPLVAFRNCETKSICVANCPTQSFSFPHYKSKPNYNSSGKPSEAFEKQIECGPNRPIFPNMSSVEIAIGKHLCAAITTKSMTGTTYKTLQHKCIPNISETEIEFIVDLIDNLVPQTNIPWRITYEFTKRIGVNGNEIENKIMYTFSDMLQGWPVLLGFLVGGLILTVTLVYSMVFISKYIFIITNVINAGVLVISIYVCYARGGIFDHFSFNIFENDIWGLSLIFSTIVAITITVQYFIERMGTLIILELIKETTTTIKCIKTLLVFPLIFYGIRIGAILFSMYIGFTIKSTSETDFKLTNNGVKNSSCICNNYLDGGFCNPTVIDQCMLDFDDNGISYCDLSCSEIPEKEKLHQNLVDFSQLTNLFGYFWALEYLYLLELAILASTFATYYWTFHKHEIPDFTLFTGIYMSIRYHLGTIFFAWIFLSIYSYIRFVIPQINGLLGLLPFSIIHFFFKYVMIVMALCGDDFYESAKEAVNLVKANTRLIIISKFMSEILFFYLKLLITAVMGAVVYLVVLFVGLIDSGYFKNDLFPVYIVCTGTYIIATEIFNIYILGVDTFTFCYIEDCTSNDGTHNSPYFMPRPLMRICGLKNKLNVLSYDNHKHLKFMK